jgi:hypothetical protein
MSMEEWRELGVRRLAAAFTVEAPLLREHLSINPFYRKSGSKLPHSEWMQFHS